MELDLQNYLNLYSLKSKIMWGMRMLSRFIHWFVVMIVPILVLWATWDTARANRDVAEMQRREASPIFTINQCPGEQDYITNIMNTDRLLISNEGEKTAEPPKISLSAYWDVSWLDRKLDRRGCSVEIFDYFGADLSRSSLGGLLWETMEVNNRSNRFEFAEIVEKELETYGASNVVVKLRFMIKIDYLSRVGDAGCACFEGNDFGVKRIDRSEYDKRVFSKEDHWAHGYNLHERDRILQDIRSYFL